MSEQEVTCLRCSSIEIDCECAGGFCANPYEYITELEAQIKAVKALPDKWRSEIIQNPTYTGIARNRRTKECAGELDNITG